jgi:RNA polymerase sigma-70 factor (ECF subfamily)
VHLPSQSTCWTLIRGASEGRSDDREDFARRYLSVVRAFLANRWRGSPLLDDLEDAVQEVFLECFRRDGVLDRLHASRPDSFRAFLHGVTRNVALRSERRFQEARERLPVPLNGAEVASDDASLSRVFDRAWARALVRQAGRLQEDRARGGGERAQRRVALLRMRCQAGLPIREIAREWRVDAAELHKEYATARREFHSALKEILGFHHPGSSAAEIEIRCAELLELLGGD